MTVVEEKHTNPLPRWSVGGIFLEALAQRDFNRLAATLESRVRLRALLPPGPVMARTGRSDRNVPLVVR